MKRLAAFMLACAASAVIAQPAPRPADSAAGYPSRPIRFVVTYPPGGGTDYVAREVGNELARLLKQPVIVDNRGGAGGVIGTEYVAKSAPDGYTLLFGTTAGMVINPLLRKTLPYDATADFEPVSLLAMAPQMLVVNIDLPVRTVGELVDYARRNPRKLNYASVGPGAPNHIATETFKMMTGTDITHVPYKGAGPAMTDVIAGQVQMTFNPLPPLLSQVKAGKLRALAVTSKSRSPAAPEVPTMEEAGIKDYEANFWYSVFVPARTPKPIIDKLNEAIRTTLANPAMQKKFVEQGLDPLSSTPKELGDLMAKDSKRLGEVVRKAGITAE